MTLPAAALSATPTIEFDGRELPEGLVTRLQEAIIDDNLRLPDTFELRFFDPERSVIEDSGVRVGSAVRIAAGGLDEAAPRPLMSGEVTAIEAEYDEQGGTVTLRGYDKSHRLARGRRTKTYQNVKYSDIAGQIADRVSLARGTIDDSGSVLDHVSQANQSDWEFLNELAREIDFEVAVVEGALDFRRPPAASAAPSEGDYDSGDPLQLVLGDKLVAFHGRLSGAGQVTAIEVRGWSVPDKEAIVGTAQPGTTSVSLQEDPASLAGRFGEATFVSVDAGPQSQRAADRLAARFGEQIGSTFAEATGIARGDPNLKAGVAVNVAIVDRAFEGRYTLTHTRHAFDLVHGYRTYFEVAGRQDRSLLGLTSGGGGRGPSAGGPMAGVAIALVDDVDDPQHLGRVRLRFPWLAEDYVGGWSRVAMLGAGASRGAVWLPETDDEVLVAFEQGDIRRPVVIGGLWNGQDDPPPYEVDHGSQKVRSFVSRKGHTIVLRDGDDSSTVELTSSDGKLSIVLDETNGELKLTADGTARMTVSSGGDLAISAGGRLTLEGQLGAELTSPVTTKIKGQMLQLNPPG